MTVIENDFVLPCHVSSPYNVRGFSYDGTMLFTAHQDVYRITDDQATDFDLALTFNSSLIGETYFFFDTIQQNQRPPHLVYAQRRDYLEEHGDVRNVIYQYRYDKFRSAELPRRTTSLA